MVQGAQAAAAELGDGMIEVQRFAPVKSDAVEQAQIIESLIEKKVDGIAVSVNDADALTDAIDKAVLRRPFGNLRHRLLFSVGHARRGYFDAVDLERLQQRACDTHFFAAGK
mgnify:CR=1 FL=1